MSNHEVRWDSGINGAAYNIAATDHSPIRVLAGPGTGKTFALMRRVMRLLQSGVNPERILVCTFTRTAARDLQNALGKLGIPGIHRVQAGTVHSFCFSLLQEADVLSITGRVPRTLLKFEERFLLEDLRGVNNENIPQLRRRLEAFSAAWARLQSDEPGWPQNTQDRVFLEALLSWLRFHNAMLIGELVPEALQFLRNNPTSPHRPDFQHVLVDEYQDLNRAEQVLLDEISRNSNLIVVGDENQSIYSFKYAHPEGIANFHENHPETHDETLNECRRCPQRVVEMANSLILNNSTARQRVLQPISSNPEGEIYSVQWPSLHEEATGLAAFIESRISNGLVLPGDILVLTPLRQIGYEIRDALNNRNVPAHSFFYEEAFDGNPTDSTYCSAQEAYTLLNLLVNPEDRVSLRCWCGFGNQSLNRTQWARILSYCEESGESPYIALQNIIAGRLKIPRLQNIIERFQLLQDRLRNLGNLRGQELIDAIFPSDQSWAEQIRSIVNNVSNENEPEELLEIIRRGVTQPELPTDVDYVRIMSLHRSKGLTANLVIIASCIEGLIPRRFRNLTPDEEQRALDEQRRLFYVAITRTRQTLVLSSVTRFPRNLAHRVGAIVRRGGDRSSALTIASRFLSELGPNLPTALQGNEWLRELEINL